ncbi:MAG: hypothetical protein ACOY3I_09240 [Verrucomicrobiota bacterium]
MNPAQRVSQASQGAGSGLPNCQQHGLLPRVGEILSSAGRELSSLGEKAVLGDEPPKFGRGKRAKGGGFPSKPGQASPQQGEGHAILMASAAPEDTGD